MNNPLDVKENNEHALEFTLQLSCLFTVSMSLEFPYKQPYMAHAFFPEHLSHHFQGLCHTFSEICTKLYALYCLIHHKITLGQICDSK
jgi:hypothetical protein